MSDQLFIAAYRFVALADPEAMRERLFASASAAGLKGTVLLAPEGINLMLSGPAPALRAWLVALQADARFATMELKVHEAHGELFRRLRVKVKDEIIRMNQPTVRPAAGRAAAVSAAILERWLGAGRCDEGRELLLLDTRNDFEVDAGAFVAAHDWRLQRFSDFPALLEARRAELVGKTVVTYCTGGIRCEKAALWMAAQGVQHVVQLDGGILRYLERHPHSPHWRGECFVFDERQGLSGAAVAAAAVSSAACPVPQPA